MEPAVVIPHADGDVHGFDWRYENAPAEKYIYDMRLLEKALECALCHNQPC
jgi:hypothetical protein